MQEFVREEEEPAMASDDHDFEDDMETPSGRAAAGLRGRLSAYGAAASSGAWPDSDAHQQVEKRLCRALYGQLIGMAPGWMFHL